MLRLCLVFSTFFSQKRILFPHGFFMLFPCPCIGYLPARYVPRDEVAVAPRPRRIGQELWKAPLQDMGGSNAGITKDRQQLLSLHSGRSTWNIIIGVWKIIFFSKWVICMFHVNLPGCKSPGFFWGPKGFVC